jgi:hypothetical protein
MSRLELYIDNSQILDDIIKYIDKHEVKARIISKKGDILDTYSNTHSIPSSCDFSYAPPTMNEMLSDTTIAIPSRHLKNVLGPENINKYGEVRKSAVYAVINNYISCKKILVLNNNVYLDDHLKNILCVSYNSMTYIEIYQKLNEMLTDKI